MTSENHLPLPNICDEAFLELQTKELDGRDGSFRIAAAKRRPPKLKPRNHDSFLNRSNQSSLSALSISFKDTSNITHEIQSSFYDKTKELPYFEQCFEIISVIGEGSFGEVFKVRSREDGLMYAVKKSKEYFRSEHYRQERLEEVKRYEQFSNNENCVKLYHAWEQEDRLYMQMELCQGSLEDYLRKTKVITEDKIWSILLDLLLAVKGLHDRNLIHLDIKMDNILVGNDGSCKLADFGLVVDADRARRAAIEGDSRYMAPELMQSIFSKAADIFSLGITILELSCNLVLPSNGPLWRQFRRGIMPDHIEKLSKELQDVIKSMMEPVPTKRPKVDALLRHKRFSKLLVSRKRWHFLRKIKQNLHEAKRVGGTKEKVEAPSVSGTPSSGNSSFSDNFDVSSVHDSPIAGMGSFTSAAGVSSFLNSTPLHHQNFRSRKDLTKTCFQNDSTPFNGADAYNSSFRNPLDKSSLRCKKLFIKSDESD